MSPANSPIIFDGHNDTLLELYQGEGQRSFFTRGEGGHVDLPRAREGGFGGGFFAVFVPAVAGTTDPDGADLILSEEGYEVRMPPELDQKYALEYALAVAASLFRLERESDGQLRVVRTATELQECLDSGVLAAVLHIEGAEPIGPGLAELEIFYQAGLRSVGITWSRRNRFAEGVPFKFPFSPDTGPGLTEEGRELVRACNRLGIMLDLSHLNERGFWDVAKLSDAPLVATHSNAHAICHSTRNLTDRQLDAIRDSDGMVGLNFAVHFLRPDGHKDANTPLEVMVEHVDYLVERIGIDRVGLGSDFDGATIPQEMGDVSGLPKLIGLLRERGYDEPSIRKLAHENWVRVLTKTWKG